VADEEVGIPRGDGQDRFERIDLVLQGRDARVNALRVGQGPAPEAPRGPTELSESFRDAAAGDLPRGWTGSRRVGARRLGRDSWLQPEDRSFQRVRTPPLNIEGDFQLEFRFQVERGDETVEVVLVGDGGRDQAIKVVNVNGWYHVAFNDNTKPFKIVKDTPQKAVLTRRGGNYELTIGGEEMILPAGPAGRFKRIDLGLQGAEARLTDLVVKSGAAPE
jgi:hypothetical protein